MAEKSISEKEKICLGAAEELKKCAEVIDAISTIYATILLVDVKTHGYEVISSAPMKEAVIAENGCLDDVKNVILERCVASDMRGVMRDFLNLETLPSRMAGLDTITGEYKTPEGRWFRARFIAKRRDERSELLEALYVAGDITDEKKHILLQNKIINALGSEYATLYMADTQTRRWTLIRSQRENVIRNVYEAEYGHEDYEDAFKVYVAKYVDEEDQPYMLERIKLENLLKETPDVGINSLNFKRVENGKTEYRQINTAKFVSDDGRVYIVLGFRNVTTIMEKQLAQEQALREALMAANHATRAKTTFLSNMSHDIRTPMNAIIGYTALAQTHIDDSEQVRDYLAKIHTSSTHLLSLINEILDMSRIESGTVKLEENAVHIPDVLHDLRTMIQGQITARQQNLYIDTLDVVNEDVITDKLRLNQVLLNLVSNAIKYTDLGGDIIVRVKELPCQVKEYATYEFTVKDNGRGMSPEFVEHVFESFTREHSATVSGVQGTGLGLSITKSIVDLMNGTIDVKSELGKGSEFTVTVDFRLTEAPANFAPIPEMVGARALVVDDDVNTCQSVSKMLRGIEMRPDWSTSGKEAVIRAKEAAEIKDEYKAYIIDYLMPDMNGIETVRRIRKVISEDVPIIVLTAYDWSDFEEEARAAGVTAFVAKPIFMSELRAVLSRKEDEIGRGDESAERKYNYSGKHVLLVEDNDLNREIATAILEGTGMIVDSVTDGTEAVNAMHKAAEDTYDLIFMDIQMPRMDGYTATREIRTMHNNKKANIPIVAMTANAFDEDKRKSFEAGMNGHISKPISMEDIARVLDQVWK